MEGAIKSILWLIGFLVVYAIGFATAAAVRRVYRRHYGVGAFWETLNRQGDYQPPWEVADNLEKMAAFLKRRSQKKLSFWDDYGASDWEGELAQDLERIVGAYRALANDDPKTRWMS